MTFDEFKSLNEQERLKRICGSEFLGRREDEQYLYELYRIDDFFVEGIMDRSSKTIREVRVFKSDSVLLVPYRDQLISPGKNNDLHAQ